MRKKDTKTAVNKSKCNVFVIIFRNKCIILICLSSAGYTVCPRSLYPFYIVSYYIKLQSRLFGKTLCKLYHYTKPHLIYLIYFKSEHPDLCKNPDPVFKKWWDPDPVFKTLLNPIQIPTPRFKITQKSFT